MGSMRHFLESVGELGVRIGHEFDRVKSDPYCLPEIAASELELAHFEVEFSAAEIVDFFWKSEVPQQAELMFSNLPLTLYRSKSFYIEALVWTTSTTTIHQHGFSGAFKVICGSSVHTRYLYRTDRKLTPSVSFGEVSSCDSEVLELGAVRRIVPGEGLLHSLYHLDSPSISLVVRTPQLEAFQPQYSYYEPGLRIDELGLEKDKAVKMAVRLLSTAHTLGHGQLEAAWIAICSKWDISRVLFLLLKLSASGLFGSDVRWAIAAVEVACDDAKGMMTRVIDALSTKNRIAAVREVISDKDLRFLLALLMTAPDRDSIFGSVRSRYPEMDSVRLVAHWLAELSVGKRVLEGSLERLGQRLQVRGGAAFQLSHDLRVAIGGLSDPSLAENLFFKSLVEPVASTEVNDRFSAVRDRLVAIPDLQVLFGVS